MAKGDTGYTVFKLEKEGMANEAADQSDENVKEKPGDSGRGSAAGRSRVEGEFGSIKTLGSGRGRLGLQTD